MFQRTCGVSVVFEIVIDRYQDHHSFKNDIFNLIKQISDIPIGIMPQFDGGIGPRAARLLLQGRDVRRREIDLGDRGDVAPLRGGVEGGEGVEDEARGEVGVERVGEALREGGEGVGGGGLIGGGEVVAEGLRKGDGHLFVAVAGGGGGTAGSGEGRGEGGERAAGVAGAALCGGVGCCGWCGDGG